MSAPTTSRAWAADPSITSAPLPRMLIRYRRPGGWEAYCGCCDQVVGSGFGRQHAAQAAVRHAERRCPQRLAVHGLRPCPYCGGWGATDGVDGYPVRCGSCHGQGTQPLHW